jgi:hypothetical protein
MRAYLAGVILQQGTARVVVGGLGGREVGLERRLGVHHDVLAARQADQQVGPEAAVFGGGHGLGVEVAVFDHIRQLDHALELNFAPSAAYVGRAEGGRQPAGFGAELSLGLEQCADLLGQSGISPGAGGLQVLDLAIDLGQRFADGPHQVGDSLLAQRQIATGGFLGMFQAGLGEVQEGLVVGLQGFGRKRLESVGELLAGVIKGGLQILVLLLLALEPLVEDGALRLPLGLGALGGQVRGWPEQYPGGEHTERKSE